MTQHVHDEKILVIPAKSLALPRHSPGIYPVDFSCYKDLFEKKGAFLWRSPMEEDETYKQIIPYMVYEYENRYFLMRRRRDASEKRLAYKFSLGIGGHIRQKDMRGSTIIDWARREFEEEVLLKGGYRIEPLGLIHDDSNAVGRVHLGCLFLLRGDSSSISVRSELAYGSLVSLDECRKIYDDMESWSQLVVDYLIAYRTESQSSKNISKPIC